MKISARNVIKGKVVEIEEGAVNSKIIIDIGGGNKITSVITCEAVKELGLSVGSTAYAVVKASNVMLAVE